MNDPTQPQSQQTAKTALAMAFGSSSGGSGGPQITTLQNQVAALQALTASPWQSKVIVWYGTSIPDSSGYPEAICSAIGATLYKRTQGGSRVHIYSGTQSAANYANTFHQALSNWSETLAEKQWIIDNYATIYTYLTDTADPTTPTPTQMAANAVTYTSGPYGAVGCQDVVRGWSFEYNLVGDFLDPSSGHFVVKPDLIIIDHGYNDVPGSTELATVTLLNTRNSANSGYAAAVTASRDRLTYSTGINYILDHLYAYDSNLNTFMPLMMVGHYTAYDPTHGVNLPLVQDQVAQYWQIPICKVREKTHENDQVSVGSQSLWAVSPWSLYTSGQDTAHDMTIHNVWIPDRTHPQSDPQKRMTKLITSIIKNFINQVF